MVGPIPLYRPLTPSSRSVVASTPRIVLLGSRARGRWWLGTCPEDGAWEPVTRRAASLSEVSYASRVLTRSRGYVA